MDALITTLSILVVSLPVIIVWVIGIALALLRWRRHPQVSLFALIAFAISIINMVVNRFLTVWLPMTMRDSGWTTVQIGTMFSAIGTITALIAAAAWAMVLCAIFGWRDGRQKKDFFPPAPPTFGDEPREQSTTT
ncbi:MAG TPA: hypothetical protein VG324_16045 [Blastocatellia bacterium]|nr:hypothetical protein [Blastocatellia bacterium]